MKALGQIPFTRGLDRAIEVATDAAQFTLPCSLGLDLYYLLTIPEHSDAIWQFDDLQISKCLKCGAVGHKNAI